MLDETYSMGLKQKMSLEETLYTIETDIDMGDYGKARDRLHGLIATYPNNLELRRKLGNIYWELKYPAKAGRYWYLDRDKNPGMLEACKTFEKECGSNPYHILRSLKFRGDINSIDEFAKDLILTLQKQAKASGYKGTIRKTSNTYNEVEAKVAPTVLIIILLALLGFMVIGIFTVIEWIF